MFEIRYLPTSTNDPYKGHSARFTFFIQISVLVPWSRIPEAYWFWFLIAATMAESVFGTSTIDIAMGVEKPSDLLANVNDSGKQRKKRRRKARLTGLSQQRRWANERERHRTRRVNDAIYALRDRLPDFLNPLHIKLSKMETICLAIRYIRQLKDMLEEDDRSRSSSDFEGIDTDLSPQLSSDFSTDGDFEELFKMDTSFLLPSSPSSDLLDIDDSEDVFWWLQTIYVQFTFQKFFLTTRTHPQPSTASLYVEDRIELEHF